MTRHTSACLAAASLLAASPAFAAHMSDPDQQAPAPDIAAAIQIEDVVVTANRALQRVDRVGASVTVLNRAAIEASQAVGVAELLAQTPAVSFTRNGGLGATTGVNIRGAESYHTVVLLDGVKMNDPSSTQGGVNFGNLLVGDAARIEVLRGAQSTLWGSQAIGGVVNIVTTEPTEAFQGDFQVEGGARETGFVRLGLGGASQRLTWRLAASSLTTDGFSAYRTGTEADGYRNTSLSGRLRYALADQVSLDLRAVWSKGRNDFDAWNGDSDEYGRTREWASYAGLNFDLLDGRFRNRIGYAYTDTDRENFNPATPAAPQTFDARGQNRRWEYQGTFALTSALNAVFGAETERSEMSVRSPSTFAPNPPATVGKAGVDSLYGQLQWTAAPGLTLTAGLRYEDHDAYGDHLLGQAAAAWALNGGDTVLRASYGQGFRAPGLYELYSEYGNLTLQPEEFDAWEIGVEQRLGGRALVSATYFNRQADNEIRYNGCAFGTTDPLCTVGGVSRWGYYRNLQETETQGVELAGRVDVTRAFSISANYTWTDAEIASGANAGRRMVRRPEHMGNVTASYRWAFGLDTAVAVRFVGETFNDEGNTVTVSDYALVDLRLVWPVSEGVELYGRVENAFDETYETVLNYGTPGRGAFVGVRTRF